jgi:hypothetical protein
MSLCEIPVCDDLGTNPGDTVKPVESGLTAGNRPGRLVWLPRGMACCWLCCGVWLFFENSTGCLISQCQVCLVPVFWGLFFGDTFFGVLPGFVFRQFLLESLILAQDERWRRA